MINDEPVNNKPIPKSVKPTVKNRIYFLAKDYSAYNRYLIKHRLNSRNFYFISNERVLENMPDENVVFALDGWTVRLDEDEIKQLK